MILRTTALTLAISLATVFPGLAQQDDGAETTGALPTSPGEAAEMLRDAAENAILVRDLFGAEIAGPDGTTVGTVENLAVVPGGRIVAAIVERSDGTRVPVPYAAVTLERKAGAVAGTLDRPLSELTSDADFGGLEEALPSGAL